MTPPKSKRQKVKWKLLAAVVTSNLTSITFGALGTWSSVILNRFSTINPDNPFGRKVTTKERSLVGSLFPLGGVLGPLCSCLIVDKIGRKKTLLYFIGIPLILSLLVLIFSKSVSLYYLARFVAGFSCGNILITISMYLAELSEVSTRGMVCSSFSISFTLGELLTYAVGPYVSTVQLNIIISIIPLIFLVTFPFCPETPYYFVSKRDFQSAQKSLVQLRGTCPSAVTNELELITENVENDMKNRGSIKILLTNKRCRKALLICLGLFTFQQMSGISVMLFYASDIFRASGSNLDSNVSAIIIGVVQVLSNFITPVVVDRYGRKVLLLVSVIGLFITELPLGCYYCLLDNDFNVSSFNFLPISCLVIATLTCSFGLGPVCWIIIGEIFPANVKAKATTIAACYLCFTLSVITNVFPLFAEWIGIGGIYFIFSVSCFIGIFFIIFCVVETKGKTFLEIQKLLDS